MGLVTTCLLKRPSHDFATTTEGLLPLAAPALVRVPLVPSVIRQSWATVMNFEIVAQASHHLPLIECLLDRTFGPDRHSKTVYRLRERCDAVPELSKVALDESGQLLASLRFWPIAIEGTPAMLLGPLTVEPSIQGRGVGRALVRRGLSKGKTIGYDICVVVGEPEYYEPFGFVPATSRGLVLPGPVDPRRFQVLEMTPGALEGVSGLIEPGSSESARQGDLVELNRAN